MIYLGSDKGSGLKNSPGMPGVADDYRNYPDSICLNSYDNFI